MHKRYNRRQDSNQYRCFVIKALSMSFTPPTETIITTTMISPRLCERNGKTLFSHNVYSSSFGAFSSSVFFSSVFVTSSTLGTTSFQNATLFAWYLLSTLGFTLRTRYSCSSSVNLGHVTGEGPEWVGFGDLRKRIVIK